MKGISLRAVIQQPLNEKFYIDEGAGFIYLNDRVFNDINAWDFGFVIHLLFGMHLKIPHTSGFEIGIGGEYGGTVTNTKAGYSSIYFQIKYKLVN